MGICLMRVHADGRPDVLVSIRNGDDVIPFALTGRNVEESADAPRAGIGEHFVLPIRQALVIEVAVAIDQLHAASPSSSGSSRRGKTGTGWSRPPLSPASTASMSFCADAGMTGRTDAASFRIAMTSVPSTSAIRWGSVLRRAQGAAASM